MESGRCFEIRKYNHKLYQQPVRVAGPFLSEIRGVWELEKLNQKEPLTREELDAGWVYELNEVDCPKAQRVRSTGKRRGSRGDGR